jgi:DNA-binding LacI/PurR family transcriptional regulator
MLAAGVDGMHAREGDPPVTAWDLHPERQGEEAIEMLLGRLAGDTSTKSRYVEATPHLRASTGC